MSGKANVTVLAPSRNVPSMVDEIEDGSVERAVKAATQAYVRFDSDGDVPVVSYDGGIDQAVRTALHTAESTDGPDLLVVLTDFEGDHEAATRTLEQLDGDFVVFVPVSNQGYDEAYATYLDDESTHADLIDVVSLADLSNAGVANDEVGPWHDALVA